MDDEKLKMNEILIGIRHKRNFTVLDKFGEIVDEIVDNPENGFPKGYFDSVSVDGFTKTITGKNTKNYIRFTQFDLIYSCKLGDSADLQEELNNFWKRFNNCIVSPIIEKYNIRDFSRIGIVYSYEFKDKKDYEKSLKNVVNSNFANTNSIRFSEKTATDKGRFYKGTNDYINKLYSLSVDNDTAIFSYDYQYYFNPIKSIFQQCAMDKIKEKSHQELQKDITKILGVNNGEKI